MIVEARRRVVQNGRGAVLQYRGVLQYHHCGTPGEEACGMEGGASRETGGGRGRHLAARRLPFPCLLAQGESVIKC